VHTLAGVSAWVRSLRKTLGFDALDRRTGKPRLTAFHLGMFLNLWKQAPRGL